jgi:hypothetical protein
MSFSNFIAGGAVPQSQNDAIIRLPYLYINGLQISVASTTSLGVAPGAARDSNNVMDLDVGLANLQGIIIPSPLFQNYQPGLIINCAVNGANGLDSGSLAASTQYAIYLIGDSRGYNNVAAIASLTSNATPILPSGYDSYRLIGFIETDGSSHFVYATHKPQNIAGLLTYLLGSPSSVLSGGNATSFTAIDLSTPIPTTTLPNIIVGLLVTFTPAAVGDVVQFRPTGSSATANVPTIVGAVANVAQTQYLVMIAGVGSSKPEIDYLVTSASDSVNVSVVSWAGVSNSAYPALV